MTIAELRDDYLRAMRRQGRSETTIKTYGIVLDQFLALVAGRPLTRELVREWQDRLARGHKRSTCVMYAAPVRGMLRWAATNEWPEVPRDLWLTVERVRAPRRLPKPLSRSDLERIVAHLQQPTRDVRQLRTRALFYFLLTTFSRISEAIGIDREDLVDDIVLVRQKGGTEKYLYLATDAARAAVADYLLARTDQHPGLFLSYRRHAALRARLTRQGANKIWQELAREVGIGRFTSHRLRHTGITEALEGGALELIVAEQAGHASLNTIRHYALVRLGKRRQSMEAALGPLLAARTAAANVPPPSVRLADVAKDHGLWIRKSITRLPQIIDGVLFDAREDPGRPGAYSMFTHPAVDAQEYAYLSEQLQPTDIYAACCMCGWEAAADHPHDDAGWDAANMEWARHLEGEVRAAMGAGMKL